MVKARGRRKIDATIFGYIKERVTGDRKAAYFFLDQIKVEIITRMKHDKLIPDNIQL